jgi:RHS repeat-associated protein
MTVSAAPQPLTTSGTPSSETVNPANGSVSLRIDLPTAKSRGFTLPFSISYDSNGIFHIVGYLTAQTGHATWRTDKGYLSQSGWSYAVPRLSYSEWQVQEGTYPNYYYCAVDSGFMFFDAQGGRHALGIGAQQDSTPPNCQWPSPPFGGYPAGGDSRVYATLPVSNNQTTPWPATVYTPDGTVYRFANTPYMRLPTSIEDRNGNIINITDSPSPNNTSGIFSITDTAGRTLISSGGFGGPAGSTNTLVVAGSSYQVTWKSTSANYSVPSNQIQNYLNSCVAPEAVSGPIAAETVVSQITLPNGRAYKFYYGTDNPDSNFRNPYGLISEIDYPSGGWVKYTWKLSDTMSEVAIYPAQSYTGGVKDGCIYEYKTPVVATRTVGFGGSNPSLTQTFTYSTQWNGVGDVWTSKSTTVSSLDNVTGKTALTAYSYNSMSQPAIPFAYTAYPGQVPMEAQIDSYDGNGVWLQSVQKTWRDLFNLASQNTIDKITGQSKLENYLYVNNSGFVLPQETDEYDFGVSPPSSPSRKTVATYQAFSGAPGRLADAPCKVVTSDSSGTAVSETDYFYDGGSTVCGASGAASTTAVSGLVSGTHDETAFGPSSTTPRGNVTKVVRWLNGGTSPATTYTYDETGQVSSSVDPCGNTTCSDMTGTAHTTQYFYTDAYTILSGGLNTNYTPSNGATNALLTKVIDPLGHTTTFKYDYYNSQLTSLTDPNNRVTSYIYNDTFARPTLVTRPNTGTTSYAYSDTAPNPSVTVTETIDNTVTPNVVKTSRSTMDGVGHVVQTQLTTDPDGATSVDTVYDGNGRVFRRSNPHRSSASPTDGTTTFYYDALGRTCLVVPPDGTLPTGSTCPGIRPNGDVLTTYSGNCSTITDETGKSRKSCSDAFGRLTQVFEDPAGLNYETDYTYDTLGNLLGVIQKGGSSDPSQWRQRTFQYDSLSRLTSAINPEVSTSINGVINYGTVTYTYDANGNVTAKRSPKPNQGNVNTTGTVNYCYDVLNRVRSKDYNNATCPNTSAQAAYTYDQGSPTANPIGRRTGMTDVPGSSTWTYDVMGRIATESRTTANVTKNTSYSYNQGGLLKSITYPSGRTLNYTYNVSGGSNSAGRPTSVTDTTGSVNYLKSGTYAPQGALQTYTNGFVSGGFAGISNVDTYNSRLQPVLLSATNPTATILSLCYDFHSGTSISQPPCSFPASTTGDNGNVFQIVNNRDTNRTQIFAYDNLNRIQQANSNGPTWGETFTIDSWGNLTNRNPVAGKTNYESLAAPALPNNQLTGYDYDAAGNMIRNNGSNYVYNQEGQLTKFYITTNDLYVYDGDGRRVKKNTGAVSLYWYDTSGNVLDETVGNGNLTSEYIYFGGKRIARRDADNSIHYYFSDHLGSASVLTDAVGTMSLCPAANSPMNYTTIPTGEEESDYYPYGGEMVLCDRKPQHYKFTGKERDSESGLDNFDFRYYSSSLGRFMKPDEALLWDRGDPQSLNLYSYVENNPVSNTDPDGHDCVYLNNSGSGVESVDQSSSSGECGNSGGYWVNGAVTNAQIDSNSVTLTGTTNGVDNNTHSSYLTNGDVPLNSFAQGVFSQPVIGYARGTVNNYIAPPLMTFLSFAVPGALVAGGPEITSLGIAGGTAPVVIGKVADLKEGVQPGERTLDLPDQGNPQSNWAQNSGRLREAMNEGRPIRDASAGNPGSNTGFLRAERNLLQDHGWTLQGEYWVPPSH